MIIDLLLITYSTLWYIPQPHRAMCSRVVQWHCMMISIDNFVDLYIVLHSTNGTLRLGSWICSRLQMKGAYTVGSVRECQNTSLIKNVKHKVVNKLSSHRFVDRGMEASFVWAPYLKWLWDHPVSHPTVTGEGGGGPFPQDEWPKRGGDNWPEFSFEFKMSVVLPTFVPYNLLCEARANEHQLALSQK
jgi:hypothetical protein